MATQQQFIDFLSEIEPSPSTKSACISAHSTLRTKLQSHETYKGIHVNTYLSGSYARNTALRPRQTNGTVRRPDVDIIVVTNHTHNDLPSDVIATLRKVVKSLGYTEVEANRRSICVSLGSVEMDVVPVISSPWADSGWLIADKSEEQWLATNPMGHNQWASTVNKKASGYFVPLVKLVKWWRRENLPHLKRPKGFILFSRVKPEEFKRFYDMAEAHATLARRAQRETDVDKALVLWQKIFGDRFRKSQQKTSMLRTASLASSGLGLAFPAIAAVPPNKPPGFA